MAGTSPTSSHGGGGVSAVAPLTLTGTDPATVPLKINGASGQVGTAAFFNVVDADSGNDVFTVGGSGSVFDLRSEEQAATRLFRVRSRSGATGLEVDGDGVNGLVEGVTVNARLGDLKLWGAGIGFYGATPVAQQTGVPVTAAAIHAVLVSLGLITA